MARLRPDPLAPLDTPEELEAESSSVGGLAAGILRRFVWTGGVVLLCVLGWFLLGPG